jgi:predicted negative regulator of RcsB-dependent stress response
MGGKPTIQGITDRDMANHLDLEEQEQLDQIKHFWNQYGNLITWCLIALLGAAAAWNGYQYWQRNQASQAAALYDEVEKMVRGGDVQKMERALADMRDRFGSTAYAQQSALLVAKAMVDAGNLQAAKSALVWVGEKASDKGLAAIARLRLAGILMAEKSYDDALKVLEGDFGDAFLALVADRRGDIYHAQGKKLEAKIQYQQAYKSFEDRTEYKRLVEIKLNAMGVDPTEGTK